MLDWVKWWHSQCLGKDMKCSLKLDTFCTNFSIRFIIFRIEYNYNLNSYFIVYLGNVVPSLYEIESSAYGKTPTLFTSKMLQFYKYQN